MTSERYCERHPNVETNLACGKCGAMICPRCLVHTPVGARCPECARVRRLPTFDVTGRTLAIAVAVGVVLAIACAAAFLFAGAYVARIPYGLTLLIIAIGFIIGEGISLATNRKRGKALKIVAAGASSAAFIAILVIIGIPNIFILISFAIAIFVSTVRL
jgi:MFS family permease